MPDEALSPAWGISVGGVSERPAREGCRSDPQTACVAAVEGTLVVRMPSPFAGRRWNVDLGRSVSARKRDSPFRASAPVTAGVSWTPRRGTSSACAHKQSHAAIERHGKPRTLVRRHVLRSVQEPVLVNRHFSAPVKAVARGARARHRGRANPGNREEPAPRPRSSDEARLAARHRSARSCMARQKRKEVAASVPARKRESLAWCPHVVTQLQKS